MARKAAMLLVILGTLLSASASGKGDREVPFRDCVQCVHRCHGDRSCQNMCYEMKRSSCRANGYGPGPNRTCSCT